MLVAGATLAALVWQAAGVHGLKFGNGMPVFGDWMAFWSAGRLVLEGRIAEVHDYAAITGAHREAIPNYTLYFPFRSPPTFLLILTPLAAMGYLAGAITFLSASAALYIFAMSRILQDTRALIFALTTPTALIQLGSLQTALLLTGACALAYHWRDKRPIAAGAAIALFAIKPHLALLWPVMLAVRGRWRMFVSAACFTTLFALAAGFAFGFDAYQRFFKDLSDALNLVTTRGLPPNTLASLYASLRNLGIAPVEAFIFHSLNACAAIGVAVFIFRRRDDAASIAALCAATLLISPYLFFYDALLLAVAIAALTKSDRAIPLHETTIYAFVFMSGSLTLWIGYVLTLPICPIAAWAILLLAGIMRPQNTKLLHPSLEVCDHDPFREPAKL